MSSAASCCLAILALVLCSCGAFPLRVQISGPAGLNRGLPLTLVVRAIDRVEHQEETYSAAAQRAGQPDPARLWAGTIGQAPKGELRRRFFIKVPEKKSLGLYFLFAEPYGSWKVLFEPPLYGTVRVELEQAGVRRAIR
jgi:hypothetical protein